MKKIILLLAILLCLSLIACQAQKDPATAGETVTELPDNDGDGNPDTPEKTAAVIYISINPEIALFIDESERVIAVEFLNEDAKAAYGDLKLGGIPYQESTGLIIETAIEKNYLKADGEVTVEVSALSEAIESAKIS